VNPALELFIIRLEVVNGRLWSCNKFRRLERKRNGVSWYRGGILQNYMRFLAHPSTFMAEQDGNALITAIEWGLPCVRPAESWGGL
jgi:hypothetical protein